MSRLLLWLQRRNSVRYDVLSSLIDQALLSGGSVLLTAVLAYSLSPVEFGKFTIVWSLAVLVESGLLKPLLDDPLASVAVHLSCERTAQLRSCFLIWSAVMAGTAAALAVVLCLIWFAAGLDDPGLLAASGLVIFASRLQNAMRRICYLDQRLRPVVVASIVYFVLLSTTVATMIALHRASASTAMLCSFLASAGASSLALVRRKDLRSPTREMLVWSLQRLTRAGRWIAASGLSFWAGSVGMIPIAGLLLGGTASGSLRILFLLFAPLSQLNVALQSILIPRTALHLHELGTGAIKQVAVAKAMLFGSLSAAYGFGIVVCGVWLVHGNFFPGAYHITVVEISWMAVAMTFEAIWCGLALPLYASGQTRRFLVSRLVALPFLLTLFPFFTWMGGMTGTVVAIAASSATSVLLLGMEVIRSTPRAPRAGSIARAVPSEVL